KDTSGKVKGHDEDQDHHPAGPLRKKKKAAKVPNGLTLDPCKNNNHHHHQYHRRNPHNLHNNHLPSDQENDNPRLTHAAGKRKKKHLHKKNTAALGWEAWPASSLHHEVNLFAYSCGDPPRPRDRAGCPLAFKSGEG
ncbi:hypothetical protein NHX12_010151, partial [Muraenolepis orangiensis]